MLHTINKQVLRLAVPSILANITVPLVGIVDLAIAGHLGDTALLGGIAIGTMLFDLLYWNLGFLRAGTGGMTAQAFGRGDRKAQIGIFSQGIATAIATSVVILAIQWVFVELMFLFVECSPEVESLARQYFFIRIWAAPATLSLFVFKGWFIGMQNTVFPMVTDVWVNVSNMVVSYLLAFHTPLGFSGIAYGTVIAQWSGLLLALLLMAWRYRDLVVSTTILHSMKWKYFRSFVSINANLFLRSVMMLVVYEGFTIFAARYGDTELAVSSVMMKLLLLYSYFIDGFAYAGEALTGRFIGEENESSLHLSIRYVFFWCIVIGAVSTVAYWIFPEGFIRIMTDNGDVIAGCRPYLFWLILMPIISSVAFTWDGIYIGATATRALGMCMVGSAAAFVVVYLLTYSSLGAQAIYIAYFVHLLWRSLYLTKVKKANVYDKIKN